MSRLLSQIVLNVHVVTPFLNQPSLEDDIPKQVLDSFQQTPMREQKDAFNELV